MRAEICVWDKSDDAWHCRTYDNNESAVIRAIALREAGYEVKIRLFIEDEDTEEKKCVTV